VSADFAGGDFFGDGAAVAGLAIFSSGLLFGFFFCPFSCLTSGGLFSGSP
jgi:hypothetical protein